MLIGYDLVIGIMEAIRDSLASRPEHVHSGRSQETRADEPCGRSPRYLTVLRFGSNDYLWLQLFELDNQRWAIRLEHRRCGATQQLLGCWVFQGISYPSDFCPSCLAACHGPANQPVLVYPDNAHRVIVQAVLKQLDSQPALT